jgi:hypothetical protein
MAAMVSFPKLRVLAASEVRALKVSKAAPARKQRFLPAIVGSTSEKEVADLEQRIHRTVF